jgi:propane monooxygenase reductase subunit
MLLCSARPVGDCAIDVDVMELTDDEFRAGDRVGAFETEVVAFEELTHDTRGPTLALRDQGTMTFGAGQFVNLEIPGTDEVRSYSIANTPHVSDRIQLVVKLLPGGTFSGHLRSRLAVGDRLRVFGPLGELKLRLSHRRVLVVAGGSGLAPFLSMLRTPGGAGKAARRRPRVRRAPGPRPVPGRGAGAAGSGAARRPVRTPRCQNRRASRGRASAGSSPT